jgi:uncharacterized tellurite resistance protein B-like protein
MFSNIHQWFKEQLTSPTQTVVHSIELATAVLLYEVMRADNKLAAVEQQIYKQQLEKHFDLSQAAREDLFELTQIHGEEATDYQQFTRVINDIYGADEKRAVLDSLWSVAYADHVLSPDEDYTIRKIAELLYIPHSQFIQSKLSVKPD